MPHRTLRPSGRPATRRLGAALLLGLGLALAASPASAGWGDVSARLKQRAVRVCRGDALRFCPGKLQSRRALVSCRATKRPKLTPACGRAFDEVARALKR